MTLFSYGQWNQTLKQGRGNPYEQCWLNEYAPGVVAEIRPWKTWGRVLSWVGNLRLFGQWRDSHYSDNPDVAACQDLLDAEAREVEAWLRRLAGSGEGGAT